MIYPPRLPIVIENSCFFFSQKKSMLEDLVCLSGKCNTAVTMRKRGASFYFFLFFVNSFCSEYYYLTAYLLHSWCVCIIKYVQRRFEWQIKKIHEKNRCRRLYVDGKWGKMNYRKKCKIFVCLRFCCLYSTPHTMLKKSILLYTMDVTQVLPS